MQKFSEISVDFRPAVDPAGAMRLPTVLATLGVSRRHWYRGIQDGRFPRGQKLGKKLTVWRAKDIYALAQGAQ